jgi:pyruvate formate lyase activating enzyme
MEALFYEKKDNFVQCKLCPHFCVIKKNEKGLCGVRKNIDNKLITLVYGKTASINIDPIEKKPLYHFFPGEKVFSFGTVGCNLNCTFCQNWEISQPQSVWGRNLSPKEIISLAEKNNCKLIAATYNEPTIFFEYMFDVFKLSKKKGMFNIVVSNGFINEEPLKKLLKYADAFNIDLKSYDDDFYKNLTKSRLNPVLKTIKTIYENNKHLEITNLIIPGYNDNEKQIKALCNWIKNNLNENIPLHFSAFFPMHKLNDISATTKEKLYECRKIAKEIGLKYIYLGNINEDQITYCDCGKELIIRKNYHIIKKEKKCNCKNIMLIQN